MQAFTKKLTKAQNLLFCGKRTFINKANLATRVNKSAYSRSFKRILPFIGLGASVMFLNKQKRFSTFLNSNKFAGKHFVSF